MVKILTPSLFLLDSSESLVKISKLVNNPAIKDQILVLMSEGYSVR